MFIHYTHTVIINIMMSLTVFFNWKIIHKSFNVTIIFKIVMTVFLFLDVSFAVLNGATTQRLTLTILLGASSVNLTVSYKGHVVQLSPTSYPLPGPDVAYYK